MYVTPQAVVPGQPLRAHEAGITIRPVSGPAMAAGSPPDVFVYFWALQVDILNSAGTVMGGAHYGVQWVNAENSDDAHYGRINWGCYDGYFPEAPFPGAICRGSTFQPPFSPEGNFRWEYGWDMKFRIFKSPKQDWLAAELDAGAEQEAPYIGTNQQANEVAWRVIMKINDLPWMFVRDVLIKDADGIGYKPIGGPIFWTEYIPYGAGPDAWPGNPDGWFKEFVWDGAHPGQEFFVDYGASHATIVHNNISIKDTNWISQEGGAALTRTVPQGTYLTPPAGFHTQRPANVAPNPSLDPAARIATPRPHF